MLNTNDKNGFNLKCLTFQYRGLNHLKLYCTSTIEAWPILIADVWNYEMHVYLV